MVERVVCACSLTVTIQLGAVLMFISIFSISVGAFLVGAFLQATSRVPRWWIGERPPDMAASCDIYK